MLVMAGTRLSWRGCTSDVFDDAGEHGGSVDEC